MKLARKFALIALLSISVPAIAGDLFLVIGQSNARGRAPSAGVAPQLQQAWEYNGNGGFAPMGSISGLPTGNYWTSDTYGPIPSFARRWGELQGNNHLYVVRPKGGTGLTSEGNVLQQGFWKKGQAIHQQAINDLITAYNNSWLVTNPNRIIVLWSQGENDAAGGVFAGEYVTALNELITDLDDALYGQTGRRIDAFAIMQTGYFWGYDYSGLLKDDLLRDHRRRVEQITLAQESPQLHPKALLVSNSARYLMSPCINGVSAVGCGSHDLIHYNTASQEFIGKEAAEYLSRFLTHGIKPLSAIHCASIPSLCGPTQPIYRWVNSTALGADHVTSTAGDEFDTTSSFSFKGVRYYLFRDSASGRVPLYRRKNSVNGEYMDTINSAEGSPNYGNTVLLGYCYASATANAVVPIVRLFNGFNYMTTKDPSESNALQAAGYTVNGTLCYTH
ncbi:sialate O-acetylesterase [Aerolutibacter ruishenii]|uniref:Uncharacterized protein n=1 Tax=Aerolutibacter ruishenii TaxID=686800 RepID=A0A562LDL0_9GAMM|nr:sialate O-acetylesterase [Lysobacter ruishenii]TWI05727.1 hypothetical protein IP93_03016 [Lysobacter ruishenii]